MNEQFLVTTALKQTWPKDNQPVLFLGEWCRLYCQQDDWENINAEVAPYHWDDREKLLADYQTIQKIYERVLSELADKLNEIHSTKHSQRYWRILVGPWLGYFIQMLFDRWFMLKQVITKKKALSCYIFERDPMSVVPNDMHHFNKLYINDDWNEAIYGQLLELCWANEIKIKKVKSVINAKDNQPQSVKGIVKKFTEKQLIPKFNKLFPKEDGYFFLATYLPLALDFKLQKRLGQFPKYWRFQSVPTIVADVNRRKWTLGAAKFKPNSFELVLRQLVSRHIPTAYLEGYTQLINMVGSVMWPKNPKLIFTSNAYAGDDLFKAWSASQVQLGTPLVIGQHGGHFGMTPFAFHEAHQISIADKFLSWGWSDASRPHITPVGIFKEFGQDIRYNPKGGALMVEMGCPRYSYILYAAPVASQWLDYFNDQTSFLNVLPKKLRHQITLRLCSHDYGWCQSARWKACFPKVKIANRQQNIRQLVNKNRLYISTYNATTCLESLAWNVPTIIFWNPKHWELKPNVQPYFDLLTSVGIFHKTPEGAAQQMTDVWDDVESWWESRDVQSARAKFCNEFARSSQNPLENLQQVLSQTHVKV